MPLFWLRRSLDLPSYVGQGSFRLLFAIGLLLKFRTYARGSRPVTLTAGYRRFLASRGSRSLFLVASRAVQQALTSTNPRTGHRSTVVRLPSQMRRVRSLQNNGINRQEEWFRR